jgi:hypothetical protein
MHGIIDRFEGDKALVEVRGEIKIILRSQLPPDTREGTVVVFAEGQWSIDHLSTRRRQHQIEHLMDDLWK